MSFLEQIQRKRHNLKVAKTIITYADGTKVIQDENGVEQKLNEKSFGFIVDSKPDKIPACIIENELYLGSQDSVDNDNIHQYGITHILSVGIDIPEFSSDVNLIKKFIPLLDLPTEDIKSAINESIYFISYAIQNGGKVLVHCNAGVSRSATIVIAYLIIEKNYTFSNAMQLVKSKRECICPNSGFIIQLKNIKK